MIDFGAGGRPTRNLSSVKYRGRRSHFPVASKAPNSVQYGFGYAIQSLWITRFDPYSPLRKHRWYPLHGLMAGKSSPSEEVRGRSIERMDQKAQRARELHRSHLPKGGHRENLVPLSVKCHVQGPRTRRGHGRTSSQAKVHGIQTQ